VTVRPGRRPGRPELECDRGTGRASEPAGEPEREARAKRLVAGVPVDAVTWGEIVAAGTKVGLAAGEIEALAR